MAGVISPVSGTRTEPQDSYIVIRGSTFTFKSTFTSEDKPVVMDFSTFPSAQIFAPLSVSPNVDQPLPIVIATIQGSLVPGQQFEYQFVWNVPANLVPVDQYIISYYGTLGNINYNFGDELFTITDGGGPVGIKKVGFCTVDDVRQKKFNIDDYLPKAFASDLASRNNLIQNHINDATQRLREELNLAKSRQMTENYRLFAIYYTIWSVLLASRGEDGSSVSDQNILFWRTEWERILAQEKRESILQGIPMGRG